MVWLERRGIAGGTLKVSSLDQRLRHERASPLCFYGCDSCKADIELLQVVESALLLVLGDACLQGPLIDLLVRYLYTKQHTDGDHMLLLHKPHFPIAT